MSVRERTKYEESISSVFTSEEGSLPVSNKVIHLRYKDAKNNESERDVTVTEIKKAFDYPAYNKAWMDDDDDNNSTSDDLSPSNFMNYSIIGKCHTKKARREFRAERIVLITTPDGEDIDDIGKLLAANSPIL